MQYSEDMKNKEFKRSIKSNGLQVGLELCFKNVYRGCLSKVQWEFVPWHRPVVAESCFTVFFSCHFLGTCSIYNSMCHVGMKVPDHCELYKKVK